MEQISVEKIDGTVAGIGALGDNPIDILFERMDGEQHNVVDYLFEVEGDALNADERDILISFTTLGWHILSENGCKKTVEEESLGIMLERNSELLEKKEEESGDFETALHSLLIDDVEQPVLMGFLMNLVVDRPPEYAGDIRGESIPVIMIHMKTVIDCLIEAAGEQNRI